MLRYETFSSGFRLKKCTFDPTAVHSPCSFANLRLEISRFLVQAAQGFSEVRGSLCSHVVFVTPAPPGHSHLWGLPSRRWHLCPLRTHPGIWTCSAVPFYL